MPKTSAMVGTRYKEVWRVASALLVLLGCAPELPPAWRIDPEPRGPDGQPDPRGKLRLLAIQAEPPETGPGGVVDLSALVVIHPRQGRRQVLDGQEVGTPWPRDLRHLWLACRPAEGLSALEPCALGPPGSTLQEAELGEGARAQLVVDAGARPGTWLVTLVAATGEGPRACLERARQERGIVADSHACVVGLKRIRVSAAGPRNRNPAVQALRLEGQDEVPLDAPGARYPAEGHDLFLTLERAPDAVERAPGLDAPGELRDEQLAVSFFVTGGRLEAGRGDFGTPDCEPPCPQGLRSRVRWEPPTGQTASLEAPDGVVFFFAVLRDDRGGLSYRWGRAWREP
ncbi:MAG: hypothetical protein RMK29_05730 [Myxococcales bacterium]|nr:hypothetical protein [Myxococcales bacterium]